MPDALPRLLIASPYSGSRWKSIDNYAAGIAQTARHAGLDPLHQLVSWWAPRGVSAALDRWRRRRPLDARTPAAFDLVHFTDHGLGHHAGRTHGVPAVVTCHDVMPFVLPGFYPSRRAAFTGRALLRAPMAGLRRAAHVIAVSQTTSRDLQRHFDLAPGRISVVPVPIDDDLAPSDGAELRLAAAGITLPRGQRVMSIGDSAPHKNLELLVRAMASPDLAGASLIRAGRPLTPAQRALAASLEVDARLVELGPVHRATVVDLYNACDVLAMPSIYEGFGMPVVEAMACGTPVVCSDGGAVPEAAGGAALIVPLDRSAPAANPEVVDAFARALASALFDQSLAAGLRTRGLARAELVRPVTLAPALMAAYRRALKDA